MRLLPKSGAVSLPPELRADIVAVPAAKKHVLILPPEQIRETDGRLEVDIERRSVQEGQLVTVTGWGPPPAGAKVLAEGAPLEPEDLDVVYVLRSVYLAGGVLTPQGQRPAQALPIAELARVDYRDLLARHESAMRGGRSE